MSMLIDQITMPPKSQEVSQIQHSEQLRHDQANQDIAAQFQNTVKQNSEQTVRRAKAENDEFRYKEKKEKEKKKRQASGRSRKESEKNEKEQNNKQDSGHFDMKI